jgi:hypothetical protein
MARQHTPGHCDRCGQKLPSRPVACLGCQKPIDQTGKGQAQRFCSRECHRGFTLAAQRYAIDAVASGKLHVNDLRRFRKPARHRAPNKARQDTGTPPAATPQPPAIHSSPGAS